MSAKTKTIMSLEVVTDHDCGNYEIGEIDFKIRCHDFETFIQEYGIRGRDNLVSTLSYLIHKTYDEFQKNPPKAFRTANK